MTKVKIFYYLAPSKTFRATPMLLNNRKNKNKNIKSTKVTTVCRVTKFKTLQKKNLKTLKHFKTLKPSTLKKTPNIFVKCGHVVWCVLILHDCKITE